jgi:hypothetical protein
LGVGARASLDPHALLRDLSIFGEIMDPLDHTHAAFTERSENAITAGWHAMQARCFPPDVDARVVLGHGTSTDPGNAAAAATLRRGYNV